VKSGTSGTSHSAKNLSISAKSSSSKGGGGALKLISTRYRRDMMLNSQKLAAGRLYR
jgi:hypothetical protein